MIYIEHQSQGFLKIKQFVSIYLLNLSIIILLQKYKKKHFWNKVSKLNNQFLKNKSEINNNKQKRNNVFYDVLPN